MKQKGSGLDSLITAVGTAAVPFAFYKANSMLSKRSKKKKTFRKKSTFKKKSYLKKYRNSKTRKHKKK